MTAEQDTTTQQEAHPDDAPTEVEMCCDGSGRTAEQHRAESADHRCCIDR